MRLSLRSSESRSHPNTASRLIVASAAAVGVIYGYDVGASAGALLFLPGDFGLTTAQAASFVTILGVGQLIGALIAGRLINAIGRRGGMLLVTAAFGVFALTCALAPNLPVLDASRLLLGVAIGISTVAAPVYVAECSPTTNRGGLVIVYQLANCIGIMLAYAAAYLLAPTESWRWILGVAAIPAIGVFWVLCTRMDTPRWYVMKGRHQHAEEALRKLDPTTDTAHALAELQAALDTQAAAGPRRRAESLRVLVRRPYLRALVFLVGLGAIMKLTGINALVYYKPLILQSMGFSGYTSLLLIPAGIQVVTAIATTFSALKVDRIGRRPLMLTGLAVMALAHGLIALTYVTGVRTTSMQVLAILGFVLFQAGFGLGLGALIWVYASESLPGPLRAAGASITLTVDFGINLFIAQFFLTILDAVGGESVFLGFVVITLASWVFMWKLAPETKGRSLDGIKDYWENGGQWPESTDAKGAAAKQPESI
ncbi:sugar porter family MFS transporter [Streptomyces sp. bgisy031]|uniref:sugar porter family MFS transporter n=1 Tax=Streptomyces sp. bgisy031 TaxID=3413772 RepID=UPI003D74166B